VTMVELLMALVILGMMLPVFLGWWVAVGKAWTMGADRLEARQLAAALVRRVGQEVRAGEGFVVLPNGVAFREGQGKWVRYVLGAKGMMMREEVGAGTMVVGSGVAACRFAVESGGKLVRMEATVTVGKARVEVRQLWRGKTAL
jgi:hypothetical protein